MSSYAQELKEYKERLEKLTDEQVNDAILACRWGGGLIIFYPMSRAISEDIQRRDPSDSWIWGIEGGPKKGVA